MFPCRRAAQELAKQNGSFFGQFASAWETAFAGMAGVVSVDGNDLEDLKQVGVVNRQLLSFKKREVGLDAGSGKACAVPRRNPLPALSTPPVPAPSNVFSVVAQRTGVLERRPPPPHCTHCTSCLCLRPVGCGSLTCKVLSLDAPAAWDST